VSVVAAHLYGNGKNVKSVSLDEPIDCKGKSEFVWIGLFEPLERQLEQLEKKFHGRSARPRDACEFEQRIVRAHRADAWRRCADDPATDCNDRLPDSAGAPRDRAPRRDHSGKKARPK
jgi:hypothetical protein